MLRVLGVYGYISVFNSLSSKMEVQFGHLEASICILDLQYGHVLVVTGAGASSSL